MTMARARGRSRPARTSEATVAPPAGLLGARIHLEGKELAVLAFPMRAPRFPAAFSAAEREVALALVEGRSNAEIAAARGTSVRTVANQIVAIYRKLGVHSRPELIVALSGADAGGKAPSGRS
jgi:DNA-binding NarL/FixJ family response regulator